MDDYNLYLREKEIEEILKKAINRYGEEAQIIKTIEELNELSVELAKFLNGEEKVGLIAEETADVYIMLAQLRIMLDIDTQIDFYKEFKIKRLEERLKWDTAIMNWQAIMSITS